MTAATLERFQISQPPPEELYDISELGDGIVAPKRRTENFTVKFAANFLDSYSEFWVNDEKIDRKLSDSHVQYLAREMVSNNFRWEYVNFVLASVDGHTYRLNGQHTAWARLLAEDWGLPDANYPIQVLRYECPTIQDARRLYASIDRGRPRGQGLVVNSHLLGTEEFAGFKAATLRLMAQGMGVWLWENLSDRTVHGGDDRAYLLLKDHHKVAKEVGRFIQESRAADFKHMKRAPSVGAMFATFQRAPQIAGDFWGVIRDGIGLSDKGDPRWLLREYLKNSVMTANAKRSANSDAAAVSQEEIYRACIHAWNAHRDQRRLKHLRVSLVEDRPNAR